MKLNDELIKALHNLLGKTYGMTLIFNEKEKQPMVAHITGLRKSKKGAYISLFDNDEEVEFEGVLEKNLMEKIKSKLITKPDTAYLG